MSATLSGGTFSIWALQNTMKNTKVTNEWEVWRATVRKMINKKQKQKESVGRNLSRRGKVERVLWRQCLEAIRRMLDEAETGIVYGWPNGSEISLKDSFSAGSEQVILIAHWNLWILDVWRWMRSCEKRNLRGGWKGAWTWSHDGCCRSR